MKELKPFLISLLVIAGLSLAYTTHAQTSFFPVDLLPTTDSTRYLGTTTGAFGLKAWKGLIVDEICLTGDVCNTVWPSGGGGGTDGNWTFFNGSGLRLATSTNQILASATGQTSTTSLAKLEVGFNSALGGSFLARGSSTLQNFTFINATGTSATTTSWFSTTASSTNLFGQLINGFGLATCQSGSFLTWASGSFGCDTDDNTTYTAGDALTLTGTDFDFDGGATPSGDLGGTWASPSVTDDSHAHTGTTLSGIDISADTNLTAGDNLTLTDDDIDLDTTLTSMVAGTFSGLGTFGNLLVTGSSTLQNFTGLRSTTTHATTTNFFSTTASSTNLFAQTAALGSLTLGTPLPVTSGGTGLATLTTGRVLVTTAANTIGTSANVAFDTSTHRVTIVDLASTRSTSTSATSTSFFATTASTTSFFGAGLTTCQSNNVLTWAGGQFGCEADDSSAGGDFPFTPTADGNSTSTRLIFGNGFISQASSTFTGGFVANRSTTTNATTTNLYVSNNAVIGSGTVLIDFDGTLGSTTLQKFTFTQATGTNATTTNLFTTTASTTSFYGAGLTSCTSNNVLTWTGGQFGCEADDSSAGGDFPFTAQSYGVSTSTTVGFLNGLMSTASSTFTATSSMKAINFNANRENVSTSDSVGGVMNCRRLTFLGGCVTAHSDAGAGGGRLASFINTNTAYDTQLVHASSSSLTESTLNVFCMVNGKGCGKITLRAGTNDSSALSLSSVGSQGQGLFVQGNSATTTPVVNVFDDGSNTLFSINGYGGVNIPGYATITKATTTNSFATTASSTNLATTNFLFGGVNGNSWDDFCVSITGSAALCDGDDASGVGGTGSTKWATSSDPNFIYPSGIRTNVLIGTSSQPSFIPDDDAGYQLSIYATTTGGTGLYGNRILFGGVNPNASGPSVLIFDMINQEDLFTVEADGSISAADDNFGGCADGLGSGLDIAGIVHFDCPSASLYLTNGGLLGVGTSTPGWPVQIDDSNVPQLTLSDRASSAFNNWSFRNAGGLFYLATSSPTTFATSTKSIFSIDANGVAGFLSDVNVEGVINLQTNGVTLGTDGDGALSITGASTGQDENLTINLDDSADIALITSTTGVSGFDLSSIRLRADGIVIDGDSTFPASVDGSLIIGDGSDTGNVELEDGSMCIGDGGCTSPTGDGNLSISGNATATNATTTTLFSTTASSTSLFASAVTFGQSIFSLVQQTVTALGIWDFGGATSVEIPNGSAPTVDATGEVAVDTTGDQLIYFGASAKNVLQKYDTRSFSYSTSTAWTGTTTIYLAPAHANITVDYVYCETNTGSVGMSLYDGTNRALYMPTASTTINKFNYTASNNSFTAGETIRVDVGTPASSPKNAACTYAFTYDAS